MNIREWKDCLDNRYHLRVKYQGEQYHFSPALAISAGIAVQYLETQLRQPFLIHLPRQCNSAGWIAAIASLNLFYKDYFDYTEDYLKNLRLKRGEMVELYGAAAQFVTLADENGKKYAKVEFRNKAVTEVLLKNILALKRTQRTRINDIRVYLAKRKEIESEKSLIEETLDIDLANNRTVLKSKVLVVSGPGKRNLFSRFFRETLFKGSSLSQVCGYGENLILEKGLDKYAEALSGLEALEENKRKVKGFITELTENNPETRRMFQEEFPESGQLPFDGDSLIKVVRKIKKTDPENGNKWEKVIRKIEKVKEKDSLTELQNLRAVIIADIELAYEYSGTLKKFLDRGIGVIVLSDDSFISHTSSERFKNYLTKFPDSYRFIWNKEKLSPLFSETARPVDKEFWLFCRNFFHQEITIVAHDDEPADRAHKILEGEKLFYELEGFGKLRSSFREHLRPALFFLKNNVNNNSDEVERADRLFWKFLCTYAEACENLPELLRTRISHGIDCLDQLVRKIKSGTPPKKEATLKLLSGHLMREKPFDGVATGEKSLSKRVNSIRELKGFRSRVIFPGFPLFEFSNRVLVRAATEYYCPEITILSTPWESAVTRSYLEKHLNAVRCTDKLPEGGLWKVSVPESQMKRAEVKIIQAVEAAGLEKPDESRKEIDLEALWEKIDDSIVGEITPSPDSQENDYLIEALMLRFPGCFSLMREKHKVLVIQEQLAGDVQVEEREVRSLERGDKVIFWLNEQQVIEKIINSMPGREKNFRIMNSWREALLAVFTQYDNDIEAVEGHYRKVREAFGLECNLSKVNLLRWKSDDGLMAPHPKNLKLILAGERPEDYAGLDKDVNEIRKAKSQYQEFKSELQDRLISVIRKRLNEISKNPAVEVEFHGIGKFTLELRILSLLSKSFKPKKVRYPDTRKLIQTNT